MEHLEILEGWLGQWPQWQAGRVDTTESAPGSCGIFPQGQEILSRRTDVLGNTILRIREQYLVRRVASRGRAAALWLEDLQSWVNTRQEAPPLGSHCHIRGTKGRLVSTSQAGTATYELLLTCEYGKELSDGED